MIGRLLALVVLLAASSAAADALPRPFVRGSWDAILRAHAGRPTMIHFWGLTCGPCRAEMPELAKIVAGTSELDVVLVHADFLPGDAETVAMALDTWGLTAGESWYFADARPQRLRFEVDPDWAGEIPRTTFVAADGTRQTTVGVVHAADIRAWLAGAGRR